MKPIFVYPPASGSGNATALQSVPILPIVPTGGAVLGFNGDEWQPIDALSVLAYTDPLTAVEIDGRQYLTLGYGYGLTQNFGVLLVDYGTGLKLSGNAIVPDFGTGAGKVVEGNDSALTNTRTPTDGSVTAAKMAASAVNLASSTVTGVLGTANGGTGSALGPPQLLTGYTITPVLSGTQKWMSPTGAVSDEPIVVLRPVDTGVLRPLTVEAATAPGLGESVKVSVQRSTDRGATWSEIQSVTLVDSATNGADSATPSLSAGDWLSFGIRASAGCASVRIIAAALVRWR